MIGVMLMHLFSWNYVMNACYLIYENVTYHLSFLPHLFLFWLCAYVTSFLSGQPTYCWTGAVQRFPRWGPWVSGWMRWGPCLARRPSLGLATAPVTPWQRPPQSKTATHTNTDIRPLCPFKRAVFTGPKCQKESPGIWRDSCWSSDRHAHSRT